MIVVALPFLRDPDPETDALDELDEDDRRRLERLEARDRALSALRELEFDHRTGTISDDDYRVQIGPLRREAATALQALERDAPEQQEQSLNEKGRPTGRRT